MVLSFLELKTGVKLAVEKGRAEQNQWFIFGYEIVCELMSVLGRGVFITFSPRASQPCVCQGPEYFRNPRAETQTWLLPHAASERLELPHIHPFVDKSDECFAVGFRLVQQKQGLGAGDSPDLSSGPPQGVASQVSVLRQRLLGLKIPCALLLQMLIFQIFY